MSYRHSLLVSCAIASSAIAGVASAQADKSNQIEELVVTAERREQSLQDVPVAISAFTSERRDLLGINTIQDMTNFTPGLNYTSANDRASIRGIGRLTNQHPIATAVAVYDDGIFTTSTVTAGKTPIFTDRVEVLRGPQGTLYGRNSIGGAINVISKRPTKDFYAEVRGTYANYNHSTLEFAVSGPVVDNVQMRLAGNWDKQRKGYYRNLVPGMPSEGNVVDTYYIEGQIQAQLGDNTDVWLKVYNSGWNNGSGGPGARAGASSGYKGPDITPFGEFGGQSVNASFACAPGGVVTNVVTVNPAGCTPSSSFGPRVFASTWNENVALDQTYGIALHFTHHFEGWDFKYIGGGQNYNYTLQQDNAGDRGITSFRIPLRTSPAPTCSAGLQAAGVCGPLTIFPHRTSTYREDYHNNSHELNFSSTTDSPLQWIGGLYAYHEGYIQPVFTTQDQQPQLSLAPTPALPLVQGATLPPPYMRRLFDNRIKFREESAAAYGQIDWKFSETLTFTAGLRYTRDFVKGFERVRVLCFATTPCGITPESFGSLAPVVDITASVVYRGTDPSYPNPQGVSNNTVNGGVVFTPDGFATRGYDINFNKFTGTAGVTWQPDDDTTAYFRYGRGYKRGGISAGIASTEGEFPYTGPEYINAFDAGVKKNFGRTLQANVALFYYPYKNLQAPLTVPNLTGGIAPTQSRFLNVAKSVTQGIEIETIWHPIDHLTILANYSYTDAHVRKTIPVIDPSDPSALDKDAKPILTGAAVACTGSGTTVTATNPNPNPLCDTGTGLVQRFQNISGNSLPQSPKHKVAINATYTWDYKDWTVAPSISYVWRDHQYAGLFERDYNASPSWDQVDARVSLRDKDNHYTVIAFVKNLFDDLGYDGGSSVTRVGGVYSPATIAASNGGVRPGTIATAGTVNGVANTPITFNGVQGFTKNFALTPPRTYGVEFQYRF